MAAWRHFICGRLRSFPARNCWRPASGASSNLPDRFATANAVRCITPNSRLWNGTAPARQFGFRGRAADPFAEPERLAVAQAFARFAKIDILATFSGETADRDRFAHAARDAGIRIAEDDRWADIFSRVLVERIEPNLGIGRATILDEYPAVLSV